MSADLSSAGQSTGRPSPGLTLNLSSNNPFRNRAASPNSLATPNSFSPPPPHSPFDDPPPAARARPVSRNPFFDPSDNSTQRVASPASMASIHDRKSATAEELFDNLILDDRPAPKQAPAKPPPRVPPPRGPPPRGENMPPGGRSREAPVSHRPTRSQEEAMRARRQKEKERAGSGSGSGAVLDIFESPPKRTERRPRRNSESSVMDMKPLTEEEKKAKEQRRREREKRRAAASKDKKPSRRLDLIDQLDATSIYGTGLFHHDGPFDALNPHRNRKGTRHAPMQAFPKDSLNNSLGGAGPLNAKPDHKTFMGEHDDEAFLDYNKSRRMNEAADLAKTSRDPAVFDPTARGSILHGDESLGLGTSTFLEGTPAAMKDIQRREAESAEENMQQGLQRKKSLAQRIRGINRPPRDMNNRMPPRANFDSYGPRSGDYPSASSNGERNPFFNEFDKSEGERITVKRQDTSDSIRDSPPRGQGLERRATTDESAKPDGGFLGRMKSLKGGRRPRPEPPSATSPGTAA